MIPDSVQGWIENAETGIKIGKPGYVLTSSKNLMGMGKPDEAEAVLRKALQAGNWPESSELRMLTILCKIVMDNPNEGPSEVLKIVETSKTKDWGLILMEASALGRLGRNPDAITLLEKEMESNPNVKYEPDFISKLSTLYLAEGRDQAAVDLLAPLIEEGYFEDHVIIKQILADAYLKTRKPEKVFLLLEKQQDQKSRSLKERAQKALGGRIPPRTAIPEVFIIHGHDRDSLSNLRNLLFSIGVKPVTFNDLKKGGATTIIELLEMHIPTFNAIIALLTPDDEGRTIGEVPLELRARQNVLIEAGYGLISKREKSLLIALGNVSIPSDLEGIHRVGGLKWSAEVGFDIAKRLSEMGLNVDLSRAM